ncbi:hypothetical protein Hbut_0267 [Hyperthermus butylicus DSM 5456]|uniref:Uncharacterized protein n=2 Tax=Hyperthermus butylicus TaxID=54248 RepID=A2BJH8_HYPBU|nr:hypothetical protein Hbut_0267 [Hyperthermus butylicus DSM 5456]
MEERARLYPNECVKRVVAFIPEGHMHARLIIELCDQKIILHEAAVAGIVRAYAMVALHPTRRAVELKAQRLSKRERKLGYAEWQLVETNRPEKEVLAEAMEVWGSAELVESHS